MKMNVILNLLYVITWSSITNAENENGTYPNRDSSVVITPKIYSHMLARKREEQKLFIKHLLQGDYEKNYKMLSLAFDKILKLLEEAKATLHQADYSPKNGFPSENERLQGPVSLILENICLSGEIILHLPEISYVALKKFPNWKEIFLWGTDFVNEFPHIINENTVQMLSLFRQEINESDRTDDYVNPYRKIEFTTDGNKKSKKKGKKKRITRGPQLSRTEL